MCGVIGAYLKKPHEKELQILKKIFLESKIRGLHATGLSYVKQNAVHTEKKPVSADIFFADFDFFKCINEDGNLYLIGHCRYSTSDLLFNQPIQTSKDLSVVHNGVITQKNPKDWVYKAQTKNDSELINLAIKNKKNPIKFYQDSSIAAVELHSNKNIVFYRNGKRPLYKTNFEKGYFITSTKDIPKRALSSLNPEKVPMSGNQIELQY